MTRIVGCDPGVRGAISMIDTTDWSIQIYDMPREPGRGDKNAVSPAGVAQLFAKLLPDYTYIEDVWAFSGQGVTSSFNFGRALGILLGASSSTSVLTMVRPQEWKNATKTPKDKNEARRRAMQLFPCALKTFERVKDDGRAESAILAFYGLLSLKMAPPRPLILVQHA